MPRVVDEEERRRAITSAALELFVSKGYRATTTREICRDAGISMGTLYHYFRNKEDLFFSTVARFIEEDVEARGEISAQLASRQDAVNLLRDRFVNRFLDYKRLVTLVMDFVVNQDARSAEAMLRDKVEKYIRQHAQILTAHPGRRPTGPPTLLCAEDVAALWEYTGEGMFFLSHALPDLDIERYARLFWTVMAEHLEEG
jgi:AcrR family transcriptional regulator